MTPLESRWAAVRVNVRQAPTSTARHDVFAHHITREKVSWACLARTTLVRCALLQGQCAGKLRGLGGCGPVWVAPSHAVLIQLFLLGGSGVIAVLVNNSKGSFSFGSI